MYFGGLVVGIALSRPRLKMQQDIRTIGRELWNRSAMLRWSPYVLAKFGEVGSITASRTPGKALSLYKIVPPKIARENVLNSQ